MFIIYSGLSFQFDDHTALFIEIVKKYQKTSLRIP